MKSGVKIILLAAIFAFCIPASGCEKYRSEHDSGDLSEYITVADYKNMKISLDCSAEATEVEIDFRIAEMLDGLSERDEVLDGINTGDEVTCSAYCIVDGESYPEMSEENKTFVFGKESSDSIISLLAPSMAGMKKGDTAEIKVTLPAGKIEGKSGDYGVIFRVTVLSVFRTVTPVLTDEIAKELMPGCESVSELRQKTGQKLSDQKKAEAIAEATSELWEKVVDGSTVIVTPYELFSEKYDELCSIYESNAKSLNMSFNEYLEEYFRMTENEFENELNVKAAEMMKETLVVRYIAEKEGIVCTDDAILEYASSCAAASVGDYDSGEEYIDRFGTETVREQYLKEKVLAVLIGYALGE